MSSYEAHWRIKGQDMYINRVCLGTGNYETTFTPFGSPLAKEYERLAQQMRNLGVSERNIMRTVEKVIEVIPGAFLMNW